MEEVKLIEAEDGSLYFDIPSKFIKRCGWEDGDDVEVVINDNGSITLRKVETTDDSE